jgi:hypothetical protein
MEWQALPESGRTVPRKFHNQGGGLQVSIGVPQPISSSSDMGNGNWSEPHVNALQPQKVWIVNNYSNLHTVGVGVQYSPTQLASVEGEIEWRGMTGDGIA